MVALAMPSCDLAILGWGGGVIDLRCAHNIQVIYVDDTNLLCRDEFILSKRGITLYLNDVKCVSKFLRSSILVIRFLTLSVYLSLQSMNVNVQIV